MTTKEWRKNKDRVKEMRELLENPLLIEALALLNEEGPQYATTQETVTPTFGLVKLGRIEGYSDYSSRLKTLGTYLETDRLPTNYAREEE